MEIPGMVARRIRENVKKKIALGGRPVTVSTGVVISSGDWEEVLKEADMRMYRTKGRKIS